MCAFLCLSFIAFIRPKFFRVVKLFRSLNLLIDCCYVGLGLRPEIDWPNVFSCCVSVVFRYHYVWCCVSCAITICALVGRVDLCCFVVLLVLCVSCCSGNVPCLLCLSS